MFGVRKAWEAGMMPIWALGTILPSKPIPPGTVQLGGIKKKEIALRYMSLTAAPTSLWARAAEMSSFIEKFRLDLQTLR